MGSAVVSPFHASSLDNTLLVDAIFHRSPIRTAPLWPQETGHGMPRPVACRMDIPVRRCRTRMSNLQDVSNCRQHNPKRKRGNRPQRVASLTLRVTMMSQKLALSN